MARKNPFANLMDEPVAAEERPSLDYAIKGASKSILRSIDEMAERADKLLEGQTVVELDPALVDASFVRDRLDEDDQDYQELLEAIRERGQDSPILVRPHPKQQGRYMVVFGHRRLKVAAALGRKVRAVVKELDDRSHVVAQGQENSARANLSFIEKALFAAELSRLNYDRDNQTVLAALSIDRATLSKMLSVTAIPLAVLEAIGAAKGIGRDRWYELKQRLEKTSNLEKALAFVATDAFAGLEGDARFEALFTHVKQASRPAEKRQKAFAKTWASQDKRLTASMKSDGKSFTLAMKAKDAAGFGEYLSDKLAALYASYTASSSDNS